MTTASKFIEVDAGLRSGREAGSKGDPCHTHATETIMRRYGVFRCIIGDWFKQLWYIYTTLSVGKLTAKFLPERLVELDFYSDTGLIYVSESGAGGSRTNLTTRTAHRGPAQHGWLCSIKIAGHAKFLLSMGKVKAKLLASL